jgi:hypothetical protein
MIKVIFFLRAGDQRSTNSETFSVLSCDNIWMKNRNGSTHFSNNCDEIKIFSSLLTVKAFSLVGWIRWTTCHWKKEIRSASNWAKEYKNTCYWFSRIQRISMGQTYGRQLCRSSLSLAIYESRSSCDWPWPRLQKGSNINRVLVTGLLTGVVRFFYWQHGCGWQHFHEQLIRKRMWLAVTDSGALAIGKPLRSVCDWSQKIQLSLCDWLKQLDV